MKLKQVHRQKTIPAGSGNSAFDTRLARLGASFGVLHGIGLTRGMNLEQDEYETDRGEGTLWEYREPVFARVVSPVFRAVRNHVEHYQAKSTERAALRTLLKQSDHYLQDIGLERFQVEALLIHGGSLEDLVSGRKQAKVGRFGRLRLVANASPREGHEHALDRAA